MVHYSTREIVFLTATFAVICLLAWIVMLAD
jgi:hypothetical protein